MNTNEFVDSLIEVVRNATIFDTIDNLKEPPGRAPSKSDLELSNWFMKLSEEDVNRISKIITKAIDGSIFGILAVLDGVRAIEDDEKGVLELSYKKGDEKILLNDSKNKYLHDIYNRIVK